MYTFIVKSSADESQEITINMSNLARRLGISPLTLAEPVCNSFLVLVHFFHATPLLSHPLLQELKPLRSRSQCSYLVGLLGKVR
jgi:hypothetical protein